MGDGLAHPAARPALAVRRTRRALLGSHHQHVACQGRFREIIEEYVSQKWRPPVLGWRPPPPPEGSRDLARRSALPACFLPRVGLGFLGITLELTLLRGVSIVGRMLRTGASLGLNGLNVPRSC